ncbi:hypothetical protein [Elioraea sp.]|uniref:hypothetical protein n=1 Tax=Elioraea sp. TaxID=2185103 RepID=UPI003F6F460E
MILASALPKEWIRHPELLAELAGAASPSTALVPYIVPQPRAIVAQASRALTVAGAAPLDTAAEAEAIRAAVSHVSCPRTRLAQTAELIATRTLRRSPERGVLIRAACDTVPGVSARSLYRAIGWIKQGQGQALPARKKRADAGKRRVHLSAAFDLFAVENGVPPERLAELAERVRRLIRGGWTDAHGAATGWRSIRDNMGKVLRALFAEYGVVIPPLGRRALEPLIPPHVVKAERHFRDVAVRKHDAGRWHNRHRIPVDRSIAGLLPGQVVCVDAKTVDINIRCDDGVLRSIKIAAVMDVATGWMVAVPIAPEKGRGIRRSDTLLALGIFCREFGVPEVIQRDNGSEYDTPEVYEEITEIVRAGLSGDRPPLREKPELIAKPYNAGTKPIEAAFKRAQIKAFELMPGAHSGQWSNKRTRRQGQPPSPYPGTFAQWCEDFQKMMRLLNEDTPYTIGDRKGKTPRELVDAAIADGWKAAAQLTDEEVGFVFSDRDERVVQPGGLLNYGSLKFRHPALGSERWIGRTVEVRWPRVGCDPAAPPVLHVVDPKMKRRICVADATRASYLGKEGIARRRDLDRAQARHVAAQEAQVDPFNVFEGSTARAAALPAAMPIPTHATARAVPDGIPSEGAEAGGDKAGGATLIALDSPEHRKKREREARKAQRPRYVLRGTWDALARR